MLATATVARAQDTGIPVGSKAPAAAVETLDGKAFDIAKYLGKGPVLIEFWATWCENCKALEPSMVAMTKKYAGKVRFVGVAVAINQSSALVKRYAEKHSLPLEVYYDRKGNAAGAYDAPATSYVVVIDKAGKVVYTGVGGAQDLDSAIRKAL